MGQHYEWVTAQAPRIPGVAAVRRRGAGRLCIRALEQGQWWRMGGSEVDSLRAEFAEYHGADYALAVTNGTHALELALQVLGVGPGTEVIVPAFTFISSSQAAQRLGAVAVPVDVDPDTYCIDVAAADGRDHARRPRRSCRCTWPGCCRRHGRAGQARPPTPVCR